MKLSSGDFWCNQKSVDKIVDKTKHNFQWLYLIPFEKLFMELNFLNKDSFFYSLKTFILIKPQTKIKQGLILVVYANLFYFNK